MPVPVGYYDVNRNAIARGMPAFQTPGQIVNPSNGVGIPNPNEADGGWYATNKGGDGSGHIRPVSGDEFRLLEDSNHSNRDLIDSAAQIAAMIYGGAAASGIGAGGPAAGIGNAGLGFGGAATGTAAAVPAAESGGVTAAVVPEVDTVGGAAAGVPTDALAAPSTGGSSSGWFSKIANMLPKGDSGGSAATPAYGDYSRIADQLARTQVDNQRRQALDQAQQQGNSLADMKRRRIAAVMGAGTPQVAA